MGKAAKIIALAVVGVFSMQLACYAQFGFFKRKRAATPAEVKTQIEQLMSEDDNQRNEAMQALGEMGDSATSAIPFLIAVLSVKKDMEKEQAAQKRRSLAAKALSKITGRDFGEDQLQWQSWWEANEASVLGKPKRRTARRPPRMQNLPADTPEDVRENIFKLFSANPAEQTLAAQKIGKLGRRAAVAIPFLIGIMVVKKVSDKGGAADVIEEIKCSEAAKALANITGKDFGCKPDTWREWWKMNRDKILKGAVQKLT